jgi:hypothetical protein
MKEGVTKCEWCLHVCDNEDLECIRCGGPIAVLEPWVLQCGWCTSSNRRDLTTHCNSCGGELPHIPGTPRTPAPPEKPRPIPRGYESRIRYWKNTQFLVGAIFMLFLPTIIFPLIGIFLLRGAKKRADNQMASLRFGTATRGVIDEVEIDSSQHINHVHPVRIDYTFSTSEGDFYGYIISWDRSNLKRKVGEHVWVVCNPLNVEQNTIWPPIR